MWPLTISTVMTFFSAVSTGLTAFADWTNAVQRRCIAYRAAGGLLLLWVYYTSQIFLFGAEVAKAYVFTDADPLNG